MARTWFTLDNTSGMTPADLSIINRATRLLIDQHNMSPTERWLSTVRQLYVPGMSAVDLARAVNAKREALRARFA